LDLQGCVYLNASSVVIKINMYKKKKWKRTKKERKKPIIKVKRKTTER